MSMRSIPSRFFSIARLARQAYAPYLPHIALLTVFGFLAGILEGIGINAVIPLLTSVLGSSDPVTDTLSQFIASLFAIVGVPFVPKFLLTFIVILFVAKTLVSLVLSYIQIRITNEYERATREKLFSIVIGASWPYLLKQRIGNLETALMVDTQQATALLGRIAYMITLATSVLMYLLVAFSISPVVTAATFLTALLIFVLLRPLLERVHRLSRERAGTYRDTMHHVTEHVEGLKSIKAFGIEKEATRRALGLFSIIKESTTRMQLLQQIATQVVTPVGIGYLALVFGLAYKTPFITFAALPAILYLIYRVFTYVQQIQSNLQGLAEAVPHLERVVALQREAGGAAMADRGTRPLSLQRELVFENVEFSYETSAKVLKGLNFSIRKGDMVGLIGPSGAGKTTTVDLLLRLLEPTSGRITLDGIDAREISLTDWRKKIAYVPQDLFLINDTIRNNIKFYDPDISDSDIATAVALAHADEFVHKLPSGLDTIVGERGVNLSAGQRQRLVIARALARKPEILILDEATSALDAESEANIKKAIDELKGRITIIAIAHRLSTIMDSDTLIVLDMGKVMEQGSPKDLLKDTASYFYKVNFVNQ